MTTNICYRCYRYFETGDPSKNTCDDCKKEINGWYKDLMSVHDETWNKCNYCKKTIKSWDGNKHDHGQCINLWSEKLQNQIDETHQMGQDLLETVKNMNESKSTNTTADLNLCLAATDIIEIFDKHGFTSDTPPDTELLRHLIVEAIQKRIE